MAIEARKIQLPQRVHRKRGIIAHDVPPSKEDTKIQTRDSENPRGPTLFFKKGKTRWVVPPLSRPLYWFDIYMVKKKLIIPVPPDVFVAAGRRFKVIAQHRKLVGQGYTRWMVYEMDRRLPNNGEP